MTRTLAEFERLCLEGPVESVTPDYAAWAQSEVVRLVGVMQERTKAIADRWNSKPKPGGPRMNRAIQTAGKYAHGGVEKSLPVADRE